MQSLIQISISLRLRKQLVDRSETPLKCLIDSAPLFCSTEQRCKKTKISLKGGTIATIKDLWMSLNLLLVWTKGVRIRRMLVDSITRANNLMHQLTTVTILLSIKASAQPLCQSRTSQLSKTISSSSHFKSALRKTLIISRDCQCLSGSKTMLRISMNLSMGRL